MGFYTGEYEDMSEVATIFRKTVGAQFLAQFRQMLQQNGLHVKTYDKVARVQNIIKVTDGQGNCYLIYYQGSDREAWWGFSSNGINMMYGDKENATKLLILGRKRNNRMEYYSFKIAGEIPAEKKRCICNLDKGKPICDYKGIELEAVGSQGIVEADAAEDGKEYCFEDIKKLLGVAKNI